MIQFSEIKKPSDIPVFPLGLSFFDPYLEHYTKEVLDVGGEVYTAEDSENILGVLMYDGYEKTGCIYTRSREIFDHFCRLKPSSFLYAEIDASDIPREVFNIQTLNLEGATINHGFRYEVSSPTPKEIERFMLATHPNVNPLWSHVALMNGEKCFVVKLDGKIVGCAWVSLVNRIGWLHTQYVKPQYRRIGIATDLFYARLLWLKMKGAKSVFSEISANNIASSGVEKKANMLPCGGRVYMYLT